MWSYNIGHNGFGKRSLLGTYLLIFKYIIMNKKEVREFAMKRGFTSCYSGKQKRFYFKRLNFIKVNIHELINSK